MLLKRIIYCAIVFLSALVVSMILSNWTQAQCKSKRISAEQKLAFIESQKEKMTTEQRIVADEAQQLIPLLEKADTRSKDFLGTKLGKRVVRFYGAVKRNFSDEQARMTFETFDIVLPGEPGGGNCSCSTTWTFCGSGKHCHVEQGQCDSINDCGPLGYFECSGVCSSNHIALKESKTDPRNAKQLKSKSRGFGGRLARHQEIQRQIESRKDGKPSNNKSN